MNRELSLADRECLKSEALLTKVPQMPQMRHPWGTNYDDFVVHTITGIKTFLENLNLFVNASFATYRNTTNLIC